MEAKDTVMSDRDLLKFELKYSREDTFYWGAAFDAAIKTQAEISFEAGLREAIDYFFYEVGIVRLMNCSTMEDCKKKLPNWYAKLKEWGLKNVLD